MIDCTRVVGYTYEGVAYCDICFEKVYKEEFGSSWQKEMEEDLEGSGGVIFACDEWDYTPACFTCGEEVEVDAIEEECIECEKKYPVEDMGQLDDQKYICFECVNRKEEEGF